MIYWTTAEQRRLAELWADPKLPTAEIADMLQRSVFSVRVKAKRLGLVRPRGCRRPRRLACPKGHIYADQALRFPDEGVTPGRWQRCLRCHRERARRYRGPGR